MKLSLTHLIASLLTLAITAESASVYAAPPANRPTNGSRSMFRYAGSDVDSRPSNASAGNMARRNAGSSSLAMPYATGQRNVGRPTPSEFAKATSPLTNQRGQSIRASETDMRKYASAARAVGESKGTTVMGKVRERARSGNGTSANAVTKGKQLSPYAPRNLDTLSKAMKAGSVSSGQVADQKKSKSLYGSKGFKPDAALVKKLANSDLGKKSNDQANRRLGGRDATPVALITTDENGNERWEGTLDEQMAINAGGRYEWTDRDGVHHVTEVTPEGTRRTETLPDGLGAHETFTPHERREENAGTGDAGVDTAWGIVDGILSGVLPNVPAFGGGTGYVDPGYVVPGNTGSVDPGYASGVTTGYATAATNSQSIPATTVASGESDQDVTRFTRRSLFVANKTDEAITVYVQFRSRNASGEWVWAPADPNSSQDALTFELAAGQEGQLEHNGAPIVASRVRIWAKSATREWSEHKNEDLWLVSERDSNGKRAYFAAEVEAFRFTIE